MLLPDIPDHFQVLLAQSCLVERHCLVVVVEIAAGGRMQFAGTDIQGVGTVWCADSCQSEHGVEERCAACHRLVTVGDERGVNARV